MNSTSSSTTTLNNNNNNSNKFSNNNNSIDLLEQYFTPTVPSQSTKGSTSKDDYLAKLLSSDPQQPNEISFIPPIKQQTPTFNRSVSTSSDNSRIQAIVNDLYTATTAATTGNNNTNDDLLSLIDSKDFLECLNDPTTIDSILSQNSSNVLDSSFPSTTSKRSENEEKAISEIYKTLVTSFNPGPTSLDLPVDSSPFSSITGDFLFADNSTMSTPANRTVNTDSSVPMYRQQTSTHTYQIQQHQSIPLNTSQYPDCLSMDMVDNSTFPPNVSLSPMNTSFLPSANSTAHIEPNSMMMYSQQTSTHVQHHQAPNQMSNMYYRQSSQTPQQQQQQQMYNNFAQPPPNQVAPNYYSMQQQQQQLQPPPQQRMSTGNLPPQMNKRQALMHQQRTSQANNQQLQLHMSMNVTLPHMTPNQQQQQSQQQPQQQQQQQHRPMMNTYNDMMMPNGNNTLLQQDFHQFSPSLTNNSSLDLPYGHDLFMTPSPTGPPQPQPQQMSQTHHMNVMQAPQQPLGPPAQSTMHQPYSNMSVALSATIQQNSHNTNNLMNANVPNLTSAECRQSEELNNQMMNCLSFQTTRCTSEFVRKQLQNTIHGRQKPAGGKDLPGVTPQKIMTSPNVDSSQKGAYFRSQLASPISTPPLQTNLRSQQHQSQNKTMM